MVTTPLNKGLRNQYAHLFQAVTWPWGPTEARFMLLGEPIPNEQIANVNIVPSIGDEWVVLLLEDGSWEIPGGTLEPGENYLEAIQRELMEEAGAELLVYQTLGAWRCRSLADKPYRPHLPHPVFYRLVMFGEIKLVKIPAINVNAEKVKAVECASLDLIVSRFASQGRHDLAELYQLANHVYHAITH